MGNGKDSSDSERTISDPVVHPSVGVCEQEVSSGRIVLPVAEVDSTYCTERTPSSRPRQISRDEDRLGYYFDAESAQKRVGDTVRIHDAEKQDFYIGSASGSAGQGEDLVVGTHGGAANLNIEPQHRVQYKKNYLELPPWLTDYKSKVNLDGWLHWEVHGTRRTYKYYAHRDYAWTFRSKPEVTDFLDTGECKGKIIRKKRSANPTGRDSDLRQDPSRSILGRIESRCMGDRQSETETDSSNSHVRPSAGFREQMEIMSGKIDQPVAEGDSSDSERMDTARPGQISRDDDGLGDYFEADSGHRSAGDTVTPHAAKVVMRMKGISRSSEILQNKKKLTRDSVEDKILQESNSARGDGMNLLEKTKFDGQILIPTMRNASNLLPRSEIVATKTSDVKHLANNIQELVINHPSIGVVPGPSQAGFREFGTHAGATNLNTVPQQRVKYEKKYLDLPTWLINYKSNINLDGWLHWEVHGNGRTDKYYAHRDYACTFRSKPEVKNFLDTGKFKGNVLQKKRSADPSGQDPGLDRSTRTRQQPASASICTPQDTCLSNIDGTA